jgi:hypothetical protein
VLQLPENMEPVVLVPIGYPLDECKEKNRKTLEDILF